jgi:feruloyl-CoA synthase
MPKGVPNTHGMLCSNQESLAAIWPFVNGERPVLVDWLPWSHTFGGNHNFNLVLRNGGSLYIDAGRPAPGLFDTTLRNVTDVQPNIYLNVPLGYGLLVEALEDDAGAAEAFFERLRLLMYAAAALPVPTWSRLQALAHLHTGGPVPMTTSWGATETAPLALSAHFTQEGPKSIGVPVPGIEVKLAPVDDRLELRVRGPNVAAGYVGDAAASSSAFDGDGFYCTGDAGYLVDPSRPELGVVFDGRIGENFKLSSGTWVNVGAVRVAAVGAAGGLLQDAVVTGEGRDSVGLLVWASASGRELGDQLVGRLREVLGSGGGSAAAVSRVLLLEEPPSIDGDEITDKGYINQRAVLRRRSDEVERLYRAAESGGGVVLL